MPTALTCRICDNTDEHQTYLAREMMFGFPETFTYFRCGHCGCLQIAEIPADLSRYYPGDYYSFARLGPGNAVTQLADVISLLVAVKVVYRGANDSLVSKLLPNHRGGALRRLGRMAIDRDTRLLDVGCGNGKMLYRLRRAGFRNVMGVDPFIAEDLEYANGLRVVKSTLEDFDTNEGPWDVILFQHSLEHIPDQYSVLRAAATNLASGGLCEIRIPTVSSYAWEQYGVDWVALDAPRHLYLHSLESLQLLASRVGLTVERVVYEGDGFSLWGSEQYRLNIPLSSDRSYTSHPENSPLTREQVQRWRREARQLNREGRGDLIAVYLRKPGA